MWIPPLLRIDLDVRPPPVLGAGLLMVGLLLGAGPIPDAEGQTDPSSQGSVVSPGDSLPSTRAFLSTDSVTVGDRFTLTLVTRHREGRTVVLPEVGLDGTVTGGDADRSDGSTASAAPSDGGTGGSGGAGSPAVDSLPRIGDLHVVGAGARHVRRAADGTRVDSVELSVTTFALDTARVPPVRIEVRGETDTLETRTGPLTVTVGSLVPEDAQEPMGLMPIATFARPLWPWAAGALAVIALVAGLLYLLRNRDREEEDSGAAPEPVVDPFEAALDRLKRLEVADPEDPDRVKSFFVDLSDCLRTLVRRITAIPARELTTRELVAELRERKRDGAELFEEEDVRHVDVILRLADLAKFADARPPEKDSRSALRATRKVVLSLKNQSRTGAEGEPGRTSEDADRTPAEDEPDLEIS